jgi:RHS repeat-associated protein
MAMVEVNSGDMYFYHNNYLGTPIMMTDDTGTVVWEGDYRPFGEASVNPKSSVVSNFRFAGQYFDEETGLHYNYFRFYDPKTGRYLTPDPIGLKGGINLYSYAGNNPINLTDPLGLLTESFHETTGGGWNSPPPRYSPSHNIFRNVSLDLSKYVSASFSQTFMGKGTTLSSGIEQETSAPLDAVGASVDLAIGMLPTSQDTVYEISFGIGKHLGLGWIYGRPDQMGNFQVGGVVFHFGLGVGSSISFSQTLPDPNRPFRDFSNLELSFECDD